MRLLGLGTLGRALRERGVRGEGARTALSAVARVFGAMLLTRCVSSTNTPSCAFRGDADNVVAKYRTNPALSSTLRELQYVLPKLWSLVLSSRADQNQHAPPHPRALALNSATRSLAARQCAQVRTELALALGRLSTRSALVSDTRTAARRTSAHHCTLLLRLVDLELRHWRGLAAAAAAPDNVQVRQLDAAKARSSTGSWQVFGHGGGCSCWAY